MYIQVVMRYMSNDYYVKIKYIKRKDHASNYRELKYYYI